MKLAQSLILLLSTTAAGVLSGQSTFQPYTTQGENLIHVRTADFDAVGAKDYVVGMTVNGKVIAFDRPAISDPEENNQLWQYTPPTSFGIMLATGEANSANPGEEVLLPGTDGHLRILSRDGVLLGDWTPQTGTGFPGALYSADTGKNSAGEIRIVTGGVNGRIYILAEDGTTVGTIFPPSTRSSVPGVIRRVVVGNYDGIGGDEVISFYDELNFSGGNYFEITDLDTMERPAYWGSNGLNYNNIQEAFGWTDKQLPWAYDMDGDGDDELVAHWGVLHPEDGARTRLLSTMLPAGEALDLELHYENVSETTNTGKYLLQQGVPGDFRDWNNYPGPEMLTIYGDDLYLVNYDTRNSVDLNRFRVFRPTDHGYAHTLYHFTDGARLEDRNGGLDKMILAGPPNGDDHFYLVDLSTGQWTTDAKTIDGRGVLREVRDALDELHADIQNFSGTEAVAGKPIYYIGTMNGSMGWRMTESNIRSRANSIRNAVQEWRDELGGVSGYQPERVKFVSSIGDIDGLVDRMTNNGAIDLRQALTDFSRALAERKVHFMFIVGHGSRIFIDPETLADCFEASIFEGETYMLARSKELRESTYIDEYIPHMDALLARSAQLGVAPPYFMLCGKGAIFSALAPDKASALFPAYKDVLTLGVENSNVTVPDLSFAERVGLWLNGDVENWGCNSIGDNLAANRVVEFGGMRNGHVVFRHLFSQYLMGANSFRITSIINRDNPMYLLGDTNDPALKWSNPYRQGIWNFLRLVESGVYPNSPERDQLKGLSPVAAALHDPNFIRLREQSINHDYYKYAPPARNYVINRLACWDAYTDVPDVDGTAILLNAKRRWDNLLPTSPSGFSPIVPYATRAELEALPWCNRAYQTNGDTWSEFASLEEARDSIMNELVTQRGNQLFYVDNECFWQVTQQKDDPDTYFVALLDSNLLTPTNRTVQLKLGSTQGKWEVFDQFGSQEVPLGTLESSADAIAINIPAGAVRILTVKRPPPPPVFATGFIWHDDNWAYNADAGSWFYFFGNLQARELSSGNDYNYTDTSGWAWMEFPWIYDFESGSWSYIFGNRWVYDFSSAETVLLKQ
ncbi:hypothetical protein G0Q06_03300 [Puniceicoccales bacterium CK1056]|uniref:Lambda-carrageenase middle domain-containing protein n=1 Tax=Oceanipulchritudo coccoides TaxID=2706888 RepID=A0A6B2M169_9BACT|nr:hypothetical protein [Oceanipulchritudo coccoides]NDV61470.1 hypothetical protein [Oceanipulchritudo coccoides]